MKFCARRRFLGLLSGGIFAAPGLLRGAEPEWRLFAMEDFAPYNYRENGRFQGIDIDILDTAAQRIGVSFAYVPLPWRRALLAFVNGEGDGLFQLTPTEDRARTWRMVGPLRQTVIVVVTRADGVHAPQSIADLRGLRVGVVRGFTYGESFDRAAFFTRESSLDEQTSLRKLLLGRVDVAVIGRANARFIIDRLGLGARLRVLPQPLFAEGRYIAFHRTAAGLARGARLQAALDAMQADGTTRAILARYGEED